MLTYIQFSEHCGVGIVGFKVLEYCRNIGLSKYWDVGILGCWNIGLLGCRNIGL